MRDPELSKQYALSLMKLHDVKVDCSYIKEQIKRYFDFDLVEDFFDLGGLQEGSSILPYSSSTLEGTDQEKEKYSFLINLEGKLADINIRNMFLQTFDGIFIIPLAIKNISTKSDERITVNIKVIQGQPINPTRNLFNQEITGLEGCVFDKHLIKELLQLPENGEITYDKSYSREPIEPYIPKNNMQMIDVFGYASEPSSNADDYEQELQDYVQEFSGGTHEEYRFSIGALRPNETVWLDKVMLIQPVDEQVVLKYSIKSNNSTGELSNTLHLK